MKRKKYIKHTIIWFKNHVRLVVVVALVTVFACGVLVRFRPVFAQAVVSEIRDFLVTKAGFTFLNDASSDFLFYKQTDHYTAYAGEKESGGGHRMRLTVDRYILDISLVDVSTVTLGVSTASATPAASSSAAGSDEAREALDRIDALMKSIDTQTANIDAMLKDSQHTPQQVTSTAQLIETPQERIVLFEGVRPDTDIRYRLNEGGIKEEIILKNSDNRYHQFIFSIDIHGLKAKNVGSNVWYFYSGGKNNIFRIPKGWAKDGSGAFTNDVQASVQNNLFIITINEHWLYAKERVFPVTITGGIEIVPEQRSL